MVVSKHTNAAGFSAGMCLSSIWVPIGDNFNQLVDDMYQRRASNGAAIAQFEDPDSQAVQTLSQFASAGDRVIIEINLICSTLNRAPGEARSPAQDLVLATMQFWRDFFADHPGMLAGFAIEPLGSTDQATADLTRTYVSWGFTESNSYKDHSEEEVVDKTYLFASEQVAPPPPVPHRKRRRAERGYGSCIGGGPWCAWKISVPPRSRSRGRRSKRGGKGW